jgi:hypothetical protein
MEEELEHHLFFATSKTAKMIMRQCYDQNILRLKKIAEKWRFLRNQFMIHIL